jgi:hypothetical protein
LIRLIRTIPAIKPIIPAIINPLDISINLIFKKNLQKLFYLNSSLTGLGLQD